MSWKWSGYNVGFCLFVCCRWNSCVCWGHIYMRNMPWKYGSLIFWKATWILCYSSVILQMIFDHAMWWHACVTMIVPIPSQRMVRISLRLYISGPNRKLVAVSDAIRYGWHSLFKVNKILAIVGMQECLYVLFILLHNMQGWECVDVQHLFYHAKTLV